MKRLAGNLFSVSMGETITITATPSVLEVDIVPSLDGHAKNLTTVTRPTKQDPGLPFVYTFEVYRPHHDLAMLVLFDFVTTLPAEVVIVVSDGAKEEEIAKIKDTMHNKNASASFKT